MNRSILVVAMATAAAIVGLAMTGDASGGSNNVDSVSSCQKANQPLPRSKRHSRPPQTVNRSDRLIADVKTNCGKFQIRLDARRAPTIVNSFVFLASDGYYDGLRFDRVVPGFVIQGGDPTGHDVGGPGYRVTEPPPAGYRYRVGNVLMGKTVREPAGRAGSDFFVVVGQARYIRPEYALLGRVSTGMGTVQRIAALGDAEEEPNQTVRIDWIHIKPAAA